MLNKQNTEKLRKELITLLEQYNGTEKVKLNISKGLLDALLFEQEYIIKNDSNTFVKKIMISFELVKKLDLSNVSFDYVDISGKDFTGSKGAIINPQTIYKKDLSNTILTDTQIIGDFTEARLHKTNFTGSKGAKIDPHKIYIGNLSNAKLADTEIIGPLYNTIIVGTDFTGSKGAIINPQTIEDKNFENTNLTDSEIIGSFDDCNIDGAIYNGEKLADYLEKKYLEEEAILKNILNSLRESFSKVMK